MRWSLAASVPGETGWLAEDMANSTRRNLLQLSCIAAIAACDRTPARPATSLATSPPLPSGRYIVDATAPNSTSIQAGLDAAAAAGGGTVFVPPTAGGIYSITTALLISSNTTLEIASGVTLQRAAAIDNLLRNKSDGTVGGYSSQNKVTVRGGHWDGNAAAYPSTNVTLMTFGHCTNILVENVDFTGIVGWHGLELNACKHAIVRDSVFHDYPRGSELLQLDLANGTGAFPWFGPYDNTPCDDILLAGNVFRDGGIGVGTHLSVAGKWHTNIRIMDNHFVNLTSYCIEAQDWKQVLVQDNTFVNCSVGVYAITKASQICSEFSISNNIFTAMNSSSSATTSSLPTK